MKEEPARMRLSILQMSQCKAAITPKSKTHAPFICLVRSYDDGHDVAEKALVEVVKYAYDQWDLRYAAETLGMIGGKASLAALKAAGEEADDDEAREAIHLAIRQIRARSPRPARSRAKPKAE